MNTSLIMIIIGSALISNVVLNQFLGICSFLGVSKQMKASASLGCAVIFVITIASAVASLLYDLVLKPLGMEFMKTIVFILVIAALVQIIEIIMQKLTPGLYQALGIYLPLITTNCAVLGAATLNFNAGRSVPDATIFGCFSGIGFSLALLLFASLRERLELATPPKAFQGTPIALITAGILAMAFVGFAGLC